MLTSLPLAAAVAASALIAVQPEERGAYDAMLAQQARAAAAQFAGSPCQDATVKPVSTTVVKIADHPDIAATIERVKVEGCGRTAVENIRVGRFGGSPPWRMVVALPGETLAVLSLQQSAWPQVVAAARADAPADCKAVGLGDIYVAARPGKVDLPPPEGPAAASGPGRFGVQLPGAVEAERDKLDVSQAWVEVWPLSFCGQDRTMAVLFIPLRDHASSAILAMPVWRQMLEHGPNARPAPAP